MAYLIEGGTPVLLRVAWPSDRRGPTVAEARLAPGGVRTVHPRAPQPIPGVPTGATDRPKPGDWVSAVPVNGAPPARWPKNCEATLLRDWLRWQCSGGEMSLLRVDGLGKIGTDYFVVANTFFAQEGEARITPGTSGLVRLRVTFDGPEAHLVVRWPAGEPKPTEIAFQTDK
jgi:hypothetical protein